MRSGSQPECVSDFGVHDLPGNNDEVVSNEQPTSNWKGKFDSVHTGGPWYRACATSAARRSTPTTRASITTSWASAAAPSPTARPPIRARPKQREKKWDFSRVERIAGFTREEMKKKLELKKQGKCTCGARDIRCKTMCGTTVGPGAKEPDPKNRILHKND